MSWQTPDGKFDLISAALSKIHDEIQSGELDAKLTALEDTGVSADRVSTTNSDQQTPQGT